MPDNEILVLEDALTAFRATRSAVTSSGDGIREASSFVTAGGGDDDGLSMADRLKQMKSAHPSTSVAAIPSSVSDDDLQHLNDILLLDSYVSVASAQLLYKRNPKGWDITDPGQAADFVRQAANAKFEVINKGLSGFLSLDTSSAREMDKSVTSMDLHFEFLNELFSGFGFPEASMKELDSVLTNVTKSLDSLKMSWSDENESLDHLVFTYYFDKIAGLDAKLPRLRLFFLHIDQHSWTASIGKSSVEHFSFRMNYMDNIYVMNSDQVAKNRDEIQALLESMTKMQLDDVQSMLSPKAIDADTPAPAPAG